MNGKKKQLTLDGLPIEEREQIAEDEATEVIEENEPEKFHPQDLRSERIPEEKYSEEYVLDLAASDVYIYDLRFYEKWTREELEKAWNENFRNCNSGNFSYVLSSYKNNGGTFEKTYEVLEKNKTRCREVLHASVEEDIWRYR